MESTYFGVFTICTTRCGFVNSVFGFAARKASRHQLHKHVNAHVYLGVWRITLNSAQAVVGGPHAHVDKPFCAAHFRIPRFGKSKLDLANRDIIWSSLWKHVFEVFTICTTRCGFVNSVFGFAARKVSRHQLHKHVNAHVYLGVLAYYAKQRPSRCGSHMIMSMNRLRGTLSYSQIWEVQIGSCESRYHVMQPLEAHIHVYTYFVYGEKWPLGVGDKGKCNVSWHVYSRVCL